MGLGRQTILDFIIVIAVSLVHLCSGVHKCYKDEAEALLVFKSKLNVSYGGLDSWEKGTDCCSDWIGITCHNQSNHVVMVEASGIGIVGVISDSLCHLRFLTHLNLGMNALTGTLPPCLGKLSYLQELIVAWNELSGNIPSSFANMSSLATLTAFKNNFEGSTSLPTICMLTSLTVVYLDDNQLNGSLPSCLGNLSSLTLLSLSGNQLSGSIPSSLANLVSLTHLSLANNQLRGNVPDSLGRMSSLGLFTIYNNQIRGQIPYSLGNLSSLVTLDLSYNQLSGTLPTSFAHLSSLTELSVYGNMFNQSIPSSALPSSIQVLSLSFDHHQIVSEAFFHNLTKLEFLSLSNCLLNISTAWIPSFDLQLLHLTSCKMDSQIPLWISTQYSLVELELADNNLVGEIPSWLWDISASLLFINLTANHLQGHLPVNSSLWMQAGRMLDVSRNQLTGQIPSIWPPGMIMILLYGNMLSGNIPDSLGSLNLQLLNLATNKLNGSIPASIANCPYLQVLNLANNNLEGRVPSELGRLSQLQSMVIKNNKLTGSFPHSITNCSELFFLDIGDNLFEGQIPRSIGNLSKLRVLVMKQNNFRGFIPSEIGQLKYLQILHLSSNHLSGLIPHTILSLQAMVKAKQHGSMIDQIWPGSLDYDLILTKPVGNMYHDGLNMNSKGVDRDYPYVFSTMTSIDLSDNKLNGDVPYDIGILKGLMYLNLSINNLSGTIPRSLANISQLDSLDLSTNRFSGNIPWELDSLSLLGFLNLSNNNFSGSIPQGQHMTTFSESSYSGNPNLWGCPLPKNCSWPQFARPPASACQRLSPPECQSGKSRSHAKTVAGAVASVSVFMVCCLLLGFFWIWNSRRKKEDFSQAILQKLELTKVSYEDLFDATDGFHESNLIGVGSFGSVYKGHLKDGRVVAVKVLNLDDEESQKSFQGECRVLRKVRHRNLVKVLTSCSNADFKALVFEFMSDGSLQEHLYPHGGDGNNDCQLGLRTRLDIAIDIAHAMEYLHHDAFVQVIHCDLKPENVLLDEEMTGHVTDFGIARLTCSTQSMDSLTSTLAIKGSIGYIAPEYGLGGNVSSRGDIYSYGILLLEMLTRKRPMDSIFEGDLNLHKWVSSAFPNNLMQVLDKNLLSGIADMEMETEDLGATFKQCLVSLVGVGLACSRDSPYERPSMREVVRVLESIRNSLMGGSGVSGRMKRSISALASSPTRAGAARTEGIAGSSNQSSSTY